MTFDEAIDWCLRYGIEIDPDSPDKSYKVKGLTKLQYCHLNKNTQEYVRVVKTGSTLIEAVVEMMKEIGEMPEEGIFLK